MNTEKTQKFDPSRPFRKGDIVEPCSVKGRWFSPVWEDRSGIRYEVTTDEDPLTACLYLKDPDSPEPFLVHAAFFRLVTPVEEPYYIEEELGAVTVRSKEDPTFHKCWHYGAVTSGVIALAAATAECARLNAEYLQSTINN